MPEDPPAYELSDSTLITSHFLVSRAFNGLHDRMDVDAALGPIDRDDRQFREDVDNAVKLSTMFLALHTMEQDLRRRGVEVYSLDR